jgi:ABC-type multidrug transport system ATPase subunit
MQPTEGELKIESHNKRYSPTELAVAVVRQKAEENLCDDLTVEENLLLRLPAKTMNEKLFPKKYLTQEVIGSLYGQDQLIRKMKQLCRQLSGGQKQSLAFFAAAAQTAQILCLDEFLSSIDHSTSLLLRQKAKEYAKKNNACVIIVSHDLDVALEDADAIVVFRNGRLVNQFAKGSSEFNKSELLGLVHP